MGAEGCASYCSNILRVFAYCDKITIMKKDRQRIIYQGQSHEIVREFKFKGEDKIELRNPSNNMQFVINKSEIKL